VRRRDFITVLGGAAAWPLAARAQQPPGRVPRIGFLGMATASGHASRLEGFRLGLRELGYVEGANIIVDYRWAEDHFERLPGLLAELIRSNVDLIVTHTTPGALAAKRATTTIPIVMLTGDPVASGIVTSVARPGGNITGQSFFSPELMAKRIELLKESMPRITQIAALHNPGNPGNATLLQAMEIAAKALNVALLQFPVRGPQDFESVFERMEQAHVDAVEVTDDPVFTAHVRALVAFATKRRLLSIGPKEFAEAGGLMGYGVDFVATFRRAATFVDKILKGAKPADLPIEQATKFEFVLNLKTAKALGLTVSTATLLRADRVIE
jgi:putative ABC transport system substrate-binding protein